MPASSLGRRRPRPVADAPALEGAQLAKAWLVELVAIAPLEQAASLPGPRFADDAPRLCAAVGAALSSEAAFDDLEPGGGLAPLAAGSAELAAAASPLDAVTALEALRAVVWSAVRSGLDHPQPAQIAELADRLAAIVATLTSAALDSPGLLAPVHPGDRGPLPVVLRADRPSPADPDPHEPPHDAADARDAPDAAADAPDAPDAADDAVAGAAHEAAGASSVPGRDTDITASGAERPDAERPGDDEPPADASSEAAQVEDPPSGSSIEERSLDEPVGRLAPPERELRDLAATLRDAASSPDPLRRLRELAAPLDDPFAAAAARLRGASGPVVEDATDFRAARIAPWSAAIERRLARHRQDGLPFAVLCVEVADLDRLVAADQDNDVTARLEAVEGAVCAQLRPADALVRERAGRYWLTSPDTDTPAARALAHRIAAAVADAREHRGSPLHVVVGVATCPADADDTASLEGRAEEALFAARAAGVRVAGAVD